VPEEKRPLVAANLLKVFHLRRERAVSGTRVTGSRAPQPGHRCPGREGLDPRNPASRRHPARVRILRSSRPYADWKDAALARGDRRGGDRGQREAHESVKSVRSGEMPPWFYLLPRPHARLNASPAS
jgi:hypothetical protein